MIAYSYDENGYFNGVVICQKDPIGSAKSGKNIYLTPANATLVPPDTFDEITERPIWNGESWNIEKIPTIPETPKTPSQKREEMYNTESIIEWDGILITVTEAAQKWSYYASEGNIEKANELTALIVTAKKAIREQFPDDETV